LEPDRMGANRDELSAMSKPQVLVFIGWYSPGFKAGGPVRSLVNMVDHLRDRIDFHIVTSDTDYTESKPYEGIRPDTWTTLPGGERVWYASKDAANLRNWRHLLKERAWDSVYINGIYSWAFSILPLWLLRGSGQKRLVAVRGMLASGMMKHGAAKKRVFLAAMNLLGCYKGVAFQATNAEEVDDVKRWISQNADVQQVPNLGRKLTATAPPHRDKKPGELKLVSVARIAVEKNTLFAIGCLKDLVGDVTFDLHGPIYDEAYWRRCEEAIAGLPPNVKVSHMGTIHPDKVPALFADHHALFMPSQGENFGHTMVEALAAGLPLLISDRTPWKGLEEKDAGWDLPLDNAAAFTRALERMVQADQVQYDRWGNGAFAMGKRYLSDPGTVERSLALFTR
jgi:glycosyltransferase involved in cell wall biosynthesis